MSVGKVKQQLKSLIIFTNNALLINNFVNYEYLNIHTMEVQKTTSIKYSYNNSAVQVTFRNRETAVFLDMLTIQTSFTLKTITDLDYNFKIEDSILKVYDHYDSDQIFNGGGAQYSISTQFITCENILLIIPYDNVDHIYSNEPKLKC
ncbi:unnamed protein product [Adineta steineri]|uniref:Uncharacterized protein n=1 Tax=Adineta steineri TaxID=433720 RepID=A0A813ZLQ2_9BILA|nr:unnamed protein product [Adineta steineri]